MTGLHNRFTDKHVLITGAARGIGFEIARHFALEGASLTLFDIHEGNLKKAKEELEKITSVRIVKVDISNKKEVVDAVEATDHFKSIDVLINNAGIAFESAVRIDTLQVAGCELHLADGVGGGHRQGPRTSL